MKWGFVGTSLWGVLIIVCAIAVQLAVVLAYTQITQGEISEELLILMEYDATALSLAAFATLAICAPITCAVIKLKRNSNLKEYLALNCVSGHQIKYWTLVVIVLIALTDFLTFILGKSIVPEFMSTVYESASQPWLLVLALVFAAPIFEEIFFRGFLVSGFSSTFIGPIGAIVVSSLAWAALHMQYDLYGISTIFVAGIVLGIARLKTNSILVPILMHALMNAVATIETAIYVAR